MITLSFKSRQIGITFGFFFILAITTIQDNRLGALSLCFCIAHELGHLMMMRLFKVSISEVKLYGAGISISSDGVSSLSRGGQALIYLAGPLTNLLLAMLFNGYMRTMNLCLAVFNILPVSYFDGGRLLRLLLPENERAAKAISVLTYLSLAAVFFSAVAVRREYLSPSSLLTLCFIALSLILDK